MKENNNLSNYVLWTLTGFFSLTYVVLLFAEKNIWNGFLESFDLLKNLYSGNAEAIGGSIFRLVVILLVFIFITKLVSKLGAKITENQAIVFWIIFYLFFSVISVMQSNTYEKLSSNSQVAQNFEQQDKNIGNALTGEKIQATNNIDYGQVVPDNKNKISCNSYESKYSDILKKNQKQAESYGVFGNTSVIRETFFSSKLNTCISVVEILNDYSKPPERRMYAEDIIKLSDLFSTSAFVYNDNNYLSAKSSFYVRVNELK